MKKWFTPPVNFPNTITSPQNFIYRRKCFLTAIVSSVLLLFTELHAQNAVSTFCGSSTQGAPLAGPNGICLSPDGAFLYIADYSSHRILRVTTSSQTVANFAGSGIIGHADSSLLQSEFYFPSGIKASSDGQFLYVADNGNCLIRKIDIIGSTVSTIAGIYNAFSFADNANGLLAMFNQPVDLVLAPGDSVLYVSDSENHIIRKINLLTTEVSTVAGSPGIFGVADGIGPAARFHNPNGLSISSSGTWLYVADAGNHKIRRINLITHDVITLAGTGTMGYTDNPMGTLASFNIPQGVCVLQGDSLLYVMDTFNNRIRQIELSTTAVSTLAGGNSTVSNHFADNASGLASLFWHPVNGVLSAGGDLLYIGDQENFRIRVMETDVAVQVSTEVLDYGGVTVFPNPAKSFVEVSGLSNGYYELKNLLGDVLVSGTFLKGARIRLPEVMPGLYMLWIISGQDSYSSRILIH